MSGTDRSCTLGGGFQGKNRPFTEKLRARNEDAVAPEQLSCSRKLSADKLTSAEVARATWAAAAVAVLVVGPAGRARSPPSCLQVYERTTPLRGAHKGQCTCQAKSVELALWDAVRARHPVAARGPAGLRARRGTGHSQGLTRVSAAPWEIRWVGDAAPATYATPQHLVRQGGRRGHRLVGGGGNAVRGWRRQRELHHLGATRRARRRTCGSGKGQGELQVATPIGSPHPVVRTSGVLRCAEGG